MKGGPFKSKTLTRLWEGWTLKRGESDMVKLLSVDTEFIKLESNLECIVEELTNENKKLKEEMELLRIANMQLNRTLLYTFEHRD